MPPRPAHETTKSTSWINARSKTPTSTSVDRIAKAIETDAAADRLENLLRILARCSAELEARDAADATVEEGSSGSDSDEEAGEDLEEGNGHGDQRLRESEKGRLIAGLRQSVAGIETALRAYDAPTLTVHYQKMVEIVLRLKDGGRREGRRGG